MERKQIGIIMSSFDKDPLLSLYKGIANTAKEFGYTTQAFMIYLSYQATEGFNSGEVHIFEIADFSKYDGLVVALNTIDSKEMKEYLRGCLSNLDIPIVSIDCDLPNSYNIKTDNYGGTKALLNHLVKKHGCKKINYISGPVNNEESILRLNGYLDAMKDNFLSSEGRVYNGTFYVEDGEKAYESFKNSPLAWDYDAVVCANDTSAFSLLCEFKKKGIKVPDEVKVAGFDNMMEADARSFDLTSVFKNDYSVGQRAVDIISRVFAGETVEKNTVHPCEIVYRGSCGCNQDPTYVDPRTNRYFEKFATNNLMKVYIKTMVEKGLSCESFQEFLVVLEDLIEKIKPEFFKMSVSTDYLEIFQLDQYPTMVLTDPSGNNLELAIAMQYAKTEGYSEMITSPLHFGEKEIGIISWGDCEFPLTKDIYWEFLTNVNLILYALHSKLTLNELYRKDYLTDAYNRYGLRFYWDNFVQRSHLNKTDMTIVFVDVNDLKKINDQLGHEVGDLAIKVVASAMKAKKTKSMRVIRYGGDELLLLCPDSTEDEVKKVIEDIRNEIDSYGNIGESQLKVSASLGYFIRPYNSGLSMIDCVTKADEQMYMEKVAYHNK